MNKAIRCAKAGPAAPRKVREAALWALAPRYAQTRFAGKKALSVPPPRHTIIISKMPDDELNRYIRQICSRPKPR